jgi:hypothetical protein
MIRASPGNVQKIQISLVRSTLTLDPPRWLETMLMLPSSRPINMPAFVYSGSGSLATEACE